MTRILVVLLFGVAIVQVGCAPTGQSVAGHVISVSSTSLTDVNSFTLRTQGGEEIVFRVGMLQLDAGGFPAGHLRQHMAVNQPVAVAYHDDSGQHVADRLVDAPWLEP